MKKLIDSVNKFSKNELPGEDVFEAMHAVMHLYRSEQYRTRKSGGLAQMEGKVLRFFARNPGSTLKELGANFIRDKGQLGRLIGGLKERGLLEGKTDEADRRTIRLQLTIEGRSVQQALRRRTRRLAEKAVADIGFEDRQTLLKFLNKVAENIRAIS